MAQVGPSATVEQVAAHAGVATSTLYQHFTDREALFTAALVFAQNDWEQWMLAMVAPVPGDLEKLSVSTRLFLRAGRTHPNYGRMMAYSLGPIAEQLPLFTKSIRGHIQALAAKQLVATDRLQGRINAFTACLFSALITQFRQASPTQADNDIELALGLLGIPPARAKELAHATLPPLTKRKAEEYR
jgi:AcrR family transcriptional regulator